MKIIIIILMVVLNLTGVFSQDINQVIVDPYIGEEILYGYCNRQGLASGTFSSWFDPEYHSYNIDDAVIFNVNLDLLMNCDITIVMGTWCSDSRREVPRLFKILDYIHYPEYKLKLICVDRKKNADGTEVQDLNIELVPTIIFFNEVQEIGRIIESPVESLEVDMAKILGE